MNLMMVESGRPASPPSSADLEEGGGGRLGAWCRSMSAAVDVGRQATDIS